MANETQLKQGSLNGLRRQVNECLDSAYNKGYEDGKKEPREVKAVNVEDTNEYQIGYKVGYEDGNKIADKNFKEIQDSACDVAYNKGLEDLAHAMKVYFPLNSEERLNYFGINVQTVKYAIENSKDLIARAKAYEKKKDTEIKVGDEVKLHNALMIVTRVDEESGYISGVRASGDYSNRDPRNWQKTGRHFDEIKQLLNKLKGDENDSY